MSKVVAIMSLSLDGYVADRHDGVGEVFDWYITDHSPGKLTMPSIIHSQTADIPYNMTSTGFDVPGFRIVDNLGVVRGVVVRSRSVFGTIGAGFQTLLGGNISLFTELAERTRKQAFDTMLVQAHKAGADAVIGIRYDANELMKGVTEVLCYGTAVRVEPLEV
jgi:uncharacterized protein YbjQ (UPF0145 family)